MDSFSVESVNPCTGEAHMISFDIEMRFVDHGDDTGVIHLTRSGSTSDGYVTRGVEVKRGNRVIGFGNFNDVWSNGEGSKFQARGSWRYDRVNDDFLADSFTLQCITN